MRLRTSVVGVLAAGALFLAGCAQEGEREVVVVTEVVTEQAESTVPESTPESTPRGAPPAAPRFTLVRDHRPFTDGSDTYLFRTVSGDITCQMLDDAAAPAYGWVGGCVNGRVDAPRGATVMFSTDSGSSVWELPDGGYPGFFFGSNGAPVLQPGQVLDRGAAACFAPDEDSLGCVNLRDQEGFLISGPDVRRFGAGDYPEIFGRDGVMDVIAPYVRLQFTNGGSVICYESRNDGLYTCGDALDLDFPLMDGVDMQSNAVFFDVSGATPVIHGHNASNVGQAGENAQTVTRGTYAHYGHLIDHDGSRATFTTPQDGTFWVGVDGFGVG